MADYLNYLLYTPPIFLLKEIYTHVVISKIYIPADLPKSYIPAVEIKAISAQPTEVGVRLSWAELGNMYQPSSMVIAGEIKEMPSVKFILKHPV